MINFCNQFTITFTLGNNKDFIDAENFKSFNLYYSAGNKRPTMDMQFKLNNDKVIPYLNSGNILTLSFGKSEIKKDVLQFQLTGDDSDRQFTVGSEIKITGAFYKPEFTDYIGYECFKNKSSIEVLLQIAKEHNFTLVSNVGKTNDRQNWYRESDTVWNYIDTVWTHSYLNDDTFFIYAMDCDNIYFYDMRKLCQSGAKWLITNKYASSESSNVINIPGYKVTNTYGKVSNLVGKNLNISVYNVDTGRLLLQDYKLKSFTVIDSNKMNINSSNCLDYDYGIISEDVHENYVKAYNQNIRNNIMYQTFEIYASTDQFKDVRLLDPVMLNVYPQDDRLSGLAFITGIVYQFTPGQFKINLTINKEAPSGLKGDTLNDAS